MRKIPFLFFLFFMIICTPFCSKKDSKEVSRKKAKEKIIVRLEIDPKIPVSSKYVRVIPIFKNKSDMRRTGLTYEWFVNGKLIPEANIKLLKNLYFKKGDRVYCSFKAVKGNLKPERLKTQKFVIGNSPPVIKETPVEPFNIPGNFYYQIKAVDYDGDELKYNLVSPLNRGIAVNPRTGELTWYVEKRISMSEEQKTGNMDQRYIRIVFEVIDTDKGRAESSIDLNLATGREARGVQFQ